MKTYQINIKGQVQGVGFRPFIYCLAHDFKLNGSVSNNEEGVIIVVSGDEIIIFDFYNELIKNPPPVSRISHNDISEINSIIFDDFKIIASTKGSKLNLTLTPDFGICDDCSDEIKNPTNSRFQYPFTTCVNCGPRWAITNSFPFERKNTSIDVFQMCKNCEEEYTNPVNRRFHSQTNSCPKCGFKLQLTDAKNQLLETENTLLFSKIAQLLRKGFIIAIKNTSGYLLCCDATNEDAINKLRIRKKRLQKPFAILYSSEKLLQQELTISDQELKKLTSTERPIVIVSSKKYNGNIALNAVAPKLHQLGVMLPYSGILQLLANELSFPIIATSGNIHGSPIISDERIAKELLSEVADYFVHHNLEILHPQDDSVVKISPKFKQEVLFRRSRGFAPNYFSFKKPSLQKVLATGAHLKSSIAFVPNEYVYISQYLGNLDHFEVVERYSKTVNNFIELFEEKPDVILTDSHPHYQSNRIALELGQKFKVPVVEIQHHKAHFMAVLGEHHLVDSDEKIMGIIWDGTGFGDDGQIWGSEFFMYDKGIIDRVSHLSYFNWIAGDKMSKEPRLSLFSLATEEMYPFIKSKFTKEEWIVYRSLKNKNTLKTSSMGRLFDAVASLLNLVDFNTYEGEASIVLENQITNYDLNSCVNYHPTFIDAKIDTQLILQSCYQDLIKGVSAEIIITNFLFTLSSLIFKIANQHHINQLAFSGGVFQNTTLIDMISELANNQFNLYFNTQLSPNDENISFGQLMYYYHCSKK